MFTRLRERVHRGVDTLAAAAAAMEHHDAGDVETAVDAAVAEALQQQLSAEYLSDQ